VELYQAHAPGVANYTRFQQTLRRQNPACCNAIVDVTQLLQRASAGDAGAMNEVAPLVYSELKKLAASHLRREGSPGALQTTALVHEAFLRLAGSDQPNYENRSHFYGIASRLMRQVLVDFARVRSAQKRGPGQEIALADLGDFGKQPDEMLLTLDAALERLSREDATKARLIEMRFFGGMTAEESAAALEIPVDIVRRELRLARAWLHRELAA
jgi:RNA polymerase sigma-70 factor, ECF subfamily